MLVEKAQMRIAKIRNDMCYSESNLIKLNKNNKENNVEASCPINWFEIR